MIQVKDGSVARTTLPKSGVLKNGKTVLSGYNRLMQEDSKLAKENGWLPVEDNQPEVGKGEQVLFDGYKVEKDKVVKQYRTEAIPEPQPSEIEVLRGEVVSLKEALIEKEVLWGADIAVKK